jgi:hypothetical protein
MSIFSLAKAKLSLALAVFLFLPLSACAGIQTPETKIKIAGSNFELCKANYKFDPDLRTFSDFLLVPSVTWEMTADSSRPDTAQRSLIRRMASNEMSCRRGLARDYADATKYAYGGPSPSVVFILKEFIEGTGDALDNLVAGRLTYGQYFTALKSSISKTKKIALVSVVASEMSYQQRRQAAIDRTTNNVRKGMQENCIGCAFSKKNRTDSKGAAASQESHGILQSQKISGVNKICQYSQSGSANYVTVKAYEACPASGSRVPPSGNGIFKSSYNNGLNKACVYDKLGSKNVITVGLSESCPR